MSQIREEGSSETGPRPEPEPALVSGGRQKRPPALFTQSPHLHPAFGISAGPGEVVPEAVIFDCDGVVLDSRAAYKDLTESLFDHLGLCRLSPEEERLAFALSLHGLLDHFVPPLFRGAALDLTAALSILDFKEAVRPMPGVVLFIDYLRESGIPLALNTNTGQEVRELLEHFDLFRRFDLVVTADDVARPKPDPQGAEWIIRQWGIAPDKVVFIGDSMIDQLTARAAGTLFWAFGDAGLEADLHLSDFSCPGSAWPWSAPWTVPLPTGSAPTPSPSLPRKGLPGLG